MAIAAPLTASPTQGVISPPEISNFCEHIFRSLLKDIHREVLIWPEPGVEPLVFTSSMVMNRVSAIREELQARQVAAGQRVLLALPFQFDLLCTLLAVMAEGAIPVLPPAKASPRALVRLLREQKIQAVVTQGKVKFLFSVLLKWLGTHHLQTESTRFSSPRWLAPQAVSPDQPALISHSSGSTGQPKAIYRSHRVLQAQHLVLKEAFPPWPGQRDFPLFPNVLLHNLAAGTTSVLPDLPWADLPQLDPAKLVRQLQNGQIQSLTGNVFYFRKLLPYLERHQVVLPSVLALGLGGSPVPEYLPHTLQKHFPRAKVFVIYGSSEAEPIAVREVSGAPANPALGFAVGPVQPSLELRIRPGGEVRLPDGAAYPTGEVVVRGPHVAAATQNGWLITGDYGYLNQQGSLCLTGRRGNERLHGGVQHYQVEHVLLHLPGIEQAAVRSLASGFQVFVQGLADKEEVREALTRAFPGVPFLSISLRENLPVDTRHYSKILYPNLT